MEGNATRFEEALAAAESVIQGEQEAQRTEILGHINNAIAAVERVHQVVSVCVVCVCVCVCVY